MGKMIFIIFMSLTLNAGVIEKAKKYYAMGNHKRAAKYMPLACKEGDIRSCYFSGYLYSNGLGVKQDITKAIKYFDSACKMGMTKACFYYKKYTNNNYIETFNTKYDTSISR